jgi:hypothetical protein
VENALHHDSNNPVEIIIIIRGRCFRDYSGGSWGREYMVLKQIRFMCSGGGGL